ncbi:MAG: hemolysin family protein, partial [Myxococcota bacterium]
MSHGQQTEVAVSSGADPDPSGAVESDVAAGAVLAFVVSVVGALTISFLCSIFESVLLSVSRGHVERLARTGSKAGAVLKKWKMTDIEVPIATILILNTIAHTVGATVAGSSYGAVFGEGSLWLFSAVFTLAVLLLTEIIPKTLGVTFANRLAAPVTQAVRAISLPLKPVLIITTWMSRQLSGEHKKPVTSIEEIRLLAALGHRQGDVTGRFASLIDGVASLRELTVHDVMVPRVGISFLDGTKSIEENLQLIRESGHSRFPFTPTGDLDDVDGVILAKELLFLDHDMADTDEIEWDSLKQPLIVVPEGKALDETLRVFQEQRKHLAMVVDEYGGTQGVVTLEDVLEEIVGEIVDETDRVEKLIIKRQDGSFLCRAHAETRKLFKLLDVDHKVDFVTVGGLVADILGHVPKVDDEAVWNDIRFKVVKASSRRAERVLVSMQKTQS